MLSLSKLLLLILVVVGVWMAWGFVRRVTTQSRANLDRRRPAAPPGPQRSTAEDMEKCGICGAYVAPRSATSCGRPDCPYGR